MPSSAATEREIALSPAGRADYTLRRLSTIREDSAMLLPDGYSDLPPGKLAAVVTSLQMGVRAHVFSCVPRR